MEYDWRQEGSVEKATRRNDRWFINTTNSGGFGVDFNGEIKEGQEIELACINGSQVVGVKLDGIIIMLKTEKDIKRERKEWLTEYHQKNLDTYNKNKDVWKQDINNLSFKLKKRMNRIIKENGGFKKAFVKHMASYELFCCVEADKLVTYFKTILFCDGKKLEEDEIQKTYRDHIRNSSDYVGMPKMSDNHSGNTHGGSIHLAVGIALGMDV